MYLTFLRVRIYQAGSNKLTCVLMDLLILSLKMTSITLVVMDTNLIKARSRSFHKASINRYQHKTPHNIPTKVAVI